jgi:signal transduction histidine kinase
MEYEPEILPLQEIVEDTVEVLLSKAEEKGIRVLNTVQPDFHAYADYHMVSAVLRNLVSNALKFTPERGTVTVSGDKALSHVELSIADTGIGIPAEDLPKLFRIDVQHSTYGTAGESGTGLGLVLCQELVERNGGRIWVESHVEQGTTFRLTLPVPTS